MVAAQHTRSRAKASVTAVAGVRTHSLAARAMAVRAIAVAAVLAFLSLASAQGSQHPVAGTWEGAIEIPGSLLEVVVELTEADGAWAGTIDIPAQGAADLPLDAVAVEEDTATFRIAGVPGEPTFNGVAEGDSLSGTFTQAGQEFPFSLTRREGGSPAAGAAEQGEQAAGGEGAGAEAGGAGGEAAGQPAVGPDAAEAGAESQYVDPEGRFTAPIPTGWTATVQDGYVRLAGPEGGIYLDVVVASAEDPEGAVADAWALTLPDAELELVQTLEPPSGPGVDRTLILNYDLSDSGDLYQAIAQVVGEETYMMLVHGQAEMIQRRAAQLNVVASGFDVTGVDQVDLTGAEARPISEVLGEFEEFVPRAMDDFGVPGVSIAVVEGDEIAYLGGFGVTEAGGGEPITPSTQMMIGSTGKTMTSMLVATLVDDGIIEWDTPVVELLPRFALADAELTEQITVRNLLCACIGVPRRDLEFFFNYEELSAEGIVESLRTFEFFTDIGEAFQYSNQLVATAGYAAAAAVGASYGQLSEGYRAALAQRVLEPIQMSSTTLDFTAVLERGEYALPHQLELRSGEYEPIDVELERLLTPVEPAGAHWSTAEDMARYLLTELNRGVAPNGERVVSEENLMVTWEPQVPISATESYGLGWMVGEYKGLPWIYHGGNTLGFTSEFIFLPGEDLGIAVLANAQQVNVFTAVIAQRLLELVYDIPSEVIAQGEFQVEQTKIALEEQREQVEDRVPLTDALDFFGSYTNPALGDVSLRIADGQLWLDAGEWSTQVRPYLDRQGEPDGYVTYGAPITGVPLKFETDGDGVTAMILGEGVVRYEFEPLR